MNHIDGFLERLKAAFKSQTQKKETIASVCLKHSGVTLEASQIEIQGRTLRLNVSPAARSNVFLKKTAILEELNKNSKFQITNIL